MKNDDQSSCREDGQSQSDADLSKMFVNDGVLVDLSLKLSALRLPMNNGEQHRPGKIDNCVKSKRPSMIYRAEENLENFLRGLSKDELCRYLVELLLDCQNKVLQVGHNQPAEPERMRVRSGRRRSMSCLPGIFKDKPPGNTKRKRQHGHVASANEADPVQQEMNNCRHCKSKCDRQVNSANLKRDKATATSDAGNSLDQDSYHQAVLKAIDTLCDLRSLFEGRHSAGIKNNEIVEPMNETGAESDVRQHLCDTSGCACTDKPSYRRAPDREVQTIEMDSDRWAPEPVEDTSCYANDPQRSRAGEWYYGRILRQPSPQRQDMNNCRERPSQPSLCSAQPLSPPRIALDPYCNKSNY